MSITTVPDPTLQELQRWDREVYWHAFTQMFEYVPLMIDRAEGCVLIDVEGREYLDGVSSLWCNVHGHRHPKIDAAIREQLDRVAHCTSLGASCTTTVRLAKRIVDIAPPGLQHVFFSDSGATAVEVALKMAIQYWQQCDDPKPQKTKFVALDEAYHGDTLGAVSVGGMDRFHAIFRPLLFDVLRVETPRADRLPLGVTSDGACQHYLQGVERTLAEYGDTVAAFVLEPLVQGAAGIVVHPPGYLAGVRELTRKYGVLLIADEVAVGIGRTGRMFACEHEGVTPDILCLAKGITGGYLPLAATLSTDKLYRAFLGEHAELKTFFHGHTYGGNPLAAAAAIATLDLFEEEQTLQAMAPKIARLEQCLARLAEHPHVVRVRQRGLMAGIELTEDRSADLPYPWQQQRGMRVCRHALSHGVWLRPLGDVIVVMPPLAIELPQLDQIMDAIEDGINVECGRE